MPSQQIDLAGLLALRTDRKAEARASQPLRFALGFAAEVEVNPEVPR